MKYLFIGLGSIGQRHLRNLIRHISIYDEIFAYRVRKEQSVFDDKLQIIDGEKLDEKYNIFTFDNLDDAFDAGPNAVFICNPTSMHMEVMLESARRGIPFFVEKPVSDSLESVDELMELCRTNRVISYVGYQQRCNPIVIMTKKMLDEGKLGNVISIYAEIGERVTEWHKYEDYRRMYACRKEMGGGVVLSQIHELDYLYWFLGMPISVYAIGGKMSDFDLDVEDTADILMKYHIKGRAVNVCVHEDYVQNPPSRRCKIIGTCGQIEFDLLNNTFKEYNSAGNLLVNEVFTQDRNDLFDKEMIEFLECIKKEHHSSVPLETGLMSLEIALAIKKSIDEDRVVELKSGAGN